MILRGQIILATAYAVSSVAGSIMMLFIGLFATRALA
jgi:fluoride ion exporter CrcB/FEX